MQSIFDEHETSNKTGIRRAKSLNQYTGNNVSRDHNCSSTENASECDFSYNDHSN
jgi:hypothetical protein